MEAGDYTTLARNYRFRPGYSQEVIDLLTGYICNGTELCHIADIGAGTGKLTRQLAQTGLNVTAVEPNDAMRDEGMVYTRELPVTWKTGKAEKTGLPESAFDWVTMASAFHWTDPKLSVPEFARILKPGGFLTVMWNPRDLKRSELHMEIEEKIFTIAPDIRRKSSGASDYTSGLESTLTAGEYFAPPVFIEACHDLEMSRERYMAIWRSVNDIQVQAGPGRWQKILEVIGDTVAHLDKIIVPYRTRSWTARKLDHGI